MRLRTWLVLPALVVSQLVALGQQTAAPVQPNPAFPGLELKLPLIKGSIRWAVIGDNGTGEQPEQDVANQMQRYWTAVRYDFVTMDGDNIYGGHSPADFHAKFEVPYQQLLGEGVKFYACIGNHDDPALEVNYKPFNMGGKRYYSFTKGDVEFYVLDSNYMDPEQLQWLEGKLQGAKAKWKIAYFHHPLYTAARFHGPDVDVRQQLMPLFTKYGVNVVFSGHEHVYERIKPQNGVYFFLEGNSGELRFNNIRKPNDLDVVGFDRDRVFMLIEIAGDHLYFQAVTRAGQTVDSGDLLRQGAAANPAAVPAAKAPAAK